MPTTPAATRAAARDAARERQAEEIAHWKSELAIEHNIAHLPTTITNKVWGHAYEDGHTEGWNAISCYYGQYAEVALVAHEAGQATPKV